MPTKVHKLEILIVDNDNLGAAGVIQELENARYANRCISPQVVSVDTREVEWTDEHPLNQRATWRDAYDALFADPNEAP